MEKFYTFIPDYSIGEGEKLLFPIASEEVLKRLEEKLINKYLYRVHMALCCVDSIQEHLIKAMDEASLMALDDSEPMWKGIDKKYEEEILNSKRI